MKPLISIIVPIYNIEVYLERCIESILHQTLSSIEVILVDDGSTDRSPRICDNYQKKDHRIKVIHKQNGGLSDARNTGIDAAQGAYIAFVDGDDFICSTMYEKLYHALILQNADMSICNFAYVNETGEEISEKNQDLPIPDGVISRETALEGLAGEKEGYWVIACNKLVKREIFGDYRFPVGKIHEDEFMAHRLFYRCSKIACVAQMLYRYVQIDGSIMNSGYTVRRIDALEALIDRLSFYCNHGLYPLIPKTDTNLLGYFEHVYTHLDRRDAAVKKRMREVIHAYRAVWRRITQAGGYSPLKKGARCFFAAAPNLYLKVMVRIHKR